MQIHHTKHIDATVRPNTFQIWPDFFGPEMALASLVTISDQTQQVHLIVIACSMLFIQSTFSPVKDKIPFENLQVSFLHGQLDIFSDTGPPPKCGFETHYIGNVLTFMYLCLTNSNELNRIQAIILTYLYFCEWFGDLAGSFLTINGQLILKGVREVIFLCGHFEMFFERLRMLKNNLPHD
jgi:hypothetical protein